MNAHIEAPIENSATIRFTDAIELVSINRISVTEANAEKKASRKAGTLDEMDNSLN
jgi:hypothetical protein